MNNKLNDTLDIKTCAGLDGPIGPYVNPPGFIAEASQRIIAKINKDNATLIDECLDKVGLSGCNRPEGECTHIVDFEVYNVIGYSSSDFEFMIRCLVASGFEVTFRY